MAVPVCLMRCSEAAPVSGPPSKPRLCLMRTAMHSLCRRGLFGRCIAAGPTFITDFSDCRAVIGFTVPWFGALYLCYLGSEDAKIVPEAGIGFCHALRAANGHVAVGKARSHRCRHCDAVIGEGVDLTSVK